MTAPLQQIYGDMVGRMVARDFPPAPLPPPPGAGEPIRVGIVSSFFYRHSNWKIPIKGWIGQLDRSRFHVSGYHLGAPATGHRRGCRSDVRPFRASNPHDIDGWREEILADAPHVLIYPGLLMDHASVQLAAQRLAPVQMQFVGPSGNERPADASTTSCRAI